ncbi:IS5 family transposase [Candidatus Sulfurimonas baltica]|uniref:IS5 family transposase n=1 Tax=Candidatus Sulfurimonas baltica TaxID=2740404 RepID=A0A7S7LXW8_9BACT|nr:IS5 family transposase [Candidatus Sulfurimonas baltica]QOY51035.1 IS5 family transposase [Candidatus Sulfurimonas baltica]QOY52622.1 IS5 family transposase [Candidatus Sulfurimonas baltica]QOY52635.1 IS5 family transposase [Candidatus Sulfurimonas baltica]QOY52908.1 IS5 family transposase [Candidatus Sulfurimonas baltica]QOY53376.1 IS5 family transposase [Candidatus Sulfurimonas baltica]
MAFKDTNNTFSDIAITSRLHKVNSFLKELDSIINFEKLRPILNKNGRGGKNATGSPAYDNVLMFRILLVQKYYNLSDQSMEDALYVNLLFIRFVGLSLEDTVPDESTICRFRNSLLANKLYDKLFNAVNKQLEDNNFIAKEGKSVLVDASLIKSENTQINNKTKEQKSEDKLKVETDNSKLDIQINEELKSRTPSKKKIEKLLNAKEYNSKTMKNAQLDTLQDIDTKDVKISQEIIENEKDSYEHKNKIDTDIRIGYQSSKKQYTQGYKTHIASDEESGVILKTMTTFANTSDIDVLEPFIESIPNVKACYADKAYKSKEIDELLQSKDIENMICLKEKQKMSSDERKIQREDEKPKHKIRAKVEHRFADLKVQMKGHTTRFIGLVRNNMNFTIACIAANLRLLAYRQMNMRKSVNR